jgi:aspartyl-tRNA(Asn)/glutamyl-tRNA(Gln) amidotransferase subunit B
MKIRAAEIKFTKMQLVDLLKMITNKEITPEQGEIVLRIMAKKPEDPRKLISRLKIVPLSEKEIESAINEAINENKKAVEDYLKGREEALNFLAGNVMKITGGKADPREIIKKLRKRLDLIQRGESPK